MTRRLVPLLAALALATPALAGAPVALKAAPVDDDGMVTLGDLFDGAGAAARVPVAAKPGATVVLDAGAVQAAARRAGLDWPNAEGYRRLIVRSAAPADAGVGAAAKGNVEILTYARNLNAGEVLQPQDLVWAKVAAAPADAVGDADQAVGMAARRPLRAGAPAQGRDLAAALVVKAGDPVTVTYQNDGVTLALQGKAAASAAVGDTVAVLNPASKKTVQALVTGPGQALVGPAADRFQAARHPRYALR
ncbi:flagellar basal body P-ring formation chaperone FlgA [Phenylobacterium sp.]|jgi:flagella basal body P-ring formation protein FlgA|uniref:flagellar basal body P-ring formation chaperone FlgA n=1 Tax=Phenylobacterium sp. TaxID=1871053 RepID=UPI002F4243B3